MGGLCPPAFPLALQFVKARLLSHASCGQQTSGRQRAWPPVWGSRLHIGRARTGVCPLRQRLDRAELLRGRVPGCHLFVRNRVSAGENATTLLRGATSSRAISTARPCCLTSSNWVCFWLRDLISASKLPGGSTFRCRGCVHRPLFLQEQAGCSLSELQASHQPNLVFLWNWV
jgi:hypothetical protein